MFIKTWHEKHTEGLTAGQRIADKTAQLMGSWTFIIAQSVFVIIWMALNIIAWFEKWDPYPFILLNLVFSVQAAYAAPIIMMAQNRQNERDRIQAQADYETDTRAEHEIIKLQEALSRIEIEKLDEILKAVTKKKK